MEANIVIVGLRAGNNGRSCERHSCCGSQIEVGHLLRLKLIVVDGADITCFSRCVLNHNHTTRTNGDRGGCCRSTHKRWPGILLGWFPAKALLQHSIQNYWKVCPGVRTV